MSPSTSSLIDEEVLTLLKSALSNESLEIRLDPLWASTYSDHRLQIRRSIVQSLRHSIGQSEEEQLLDLSQPPRAKAYSLSIAHCPVLGGWCSIKAPYSIGLDLEENQRLKPELVTRISSEEELRASPSPGYVWVGKEAAFKACQEVPGLKTLSQIHTTKWFPLQKGWWLYTCQINGKQVAGRGVAGCLGKTLMSLFQKN